MAMKLRNKLLLLNISVIGTTALFMVVVVYLLASYQIRKEMWGFLSDEFHEYGLNYKIMLDDMDSIKKDMHDHFTKARMSYPIFCRVYDNSGRVVAEAENEPHAAVTDAKTISRAIDGEELNYKLTFQDNKSSNIYWCAIRQLVSPQGKIFAFEVGLKIDRINRRIERLRNYLFASVPGILFISSLGAWFVTRRSLYPFDSLLDNLQQIRSSSLEKRLPIHKTGDEVDRLALAVNEMLDEVQNAFSLTKEFTSDAAHELRTPLARLTVMLERSIGKSLSVDDSRKTLDEAYQECAHLRRLIDDLMLLARLDSGEIEEESVIIDLADIIDDMQELWTAAAEERQIQVKIATRHPLEVYGRPMLLKRLLANLVNNALRYTLEGGLIQIIGGQNNNCIEVKVQDTGKGIKKEQIARIFDRFYRVDSDRNSGVGGTGLGLSICQKIVELHRGTIEVDSMEGTGSTFTVTLPRVERDLPQAQKENTNV